MVNTQIWICALLLAGGAAAASRHPHPHPQSYHFEYFHFSREWGFGYCDTEIKQPCPQEHLPTRAAFTIHGLWPNYDDRPLGPRACPGPDFDPTLVEDLEPRFERQWPSFKKTEDDFLDHEWIEHGNCARPIINDEHSYFKTTLDLDLKYDLNRYLKAAGIYPSDTSTYRIETLLKAFDDGVGLDGSTQLQCKDGELVEVYVCLSKDLTEAIVCPKPPPPDNYCSEMLLPKTLGGSKRADATSLEASSGPAPVASA